MLFDDYAFDYGVAPAPDLHGAEAGHDASGSTTATMANDDWLLGTGLHPLDANVYMAPPAVDSPGANAGGGIAGITGGATAADHDKMLVLNPPTTDPNYWSPPPKTPVIKKVSTISWYYVEWGPLASSPKPT